MNVMKKTLQSYLDKYKKAPLPPLPFNNDEIRNLIANTGLANPNKPKFLNSLKGKIIMTISGVSLVGTFLSVLLLSNFSLKTAEPVNSIAVSAYVSDFAYTNVNKLSGNEKNSTNEGYSEIVQGRVLLLSDSELAKIGIRKTYIGYVFKSETSFESRQKWQLKEKGYNPDIKGGVYREIMTIDSTSCSGELINYGGWDVTDFSKTVPVSVEGIWKKEPYESHGSYRIGGYTPLMDINDGMVLSRERSILIQKSIKNGVLDFNTVNELLTNIDDFPNTRKLVPIGLNVYQTKNLTHRTILWYVPTREFVDLLPKKYKEYVEREYQIVEKFGEAVRLMKYAPKQDDTDITGVDMIELSVEDLQKMNVTYKDGVVEIIGEDDISEKMRTMKPEMQKMVKQMLSQAGYDPDKVKYVRTRRIIDSNGINVQQYDYNGWDYDTYLKNVPVAMVCKYKYFIDGNPEKELLTSTSTMSSDSPLLNNNDSIMHGLFENMDKMTDATENRSSKLEWRNQHWRFNISMLVPVHFRVDGLYKGQPESFIDMVLWYVPTEEFLDALPKDKGERLRKEIQLVANLENGTISPAEACSMLKGETSVFDICRLSSNKFNNLQIYPNPAKEKINVKFTLNTKAVVKIILHDYTGKSISILKDGITLETGEHDIELLLKNIEQGTYLISIADDKGEQTIRRILVE